MKTRYVNSFDSNPYIRKLERKEYDKEIRLILDVFNESEAVNYTKEGIEEFYRTVNDDSFICLLEFYGAFIDENLIGVIGFRSKDSHIALFFVDSRFQKQGIGRKLFAHILEKTGLEKITVNSSIYARSFYHKLGFKAADTEKCVNGIRFIPMEYIKKQTSDILE